MNKYALYTSNSDGVFPVIEKDGKFYITRKGSKIFSGKWELLGVCERLRGMNTLIKPNEALKITDWKFKNGSPRYSVVDKDHGTTRIWSTTKLLSFDTISDNMFNHITNTNNDEEIVLEEEASQASATGTGINGRIDSFPIIPKKIEEYTGFEHNINESTNILHELALLEDYEEELNNSFKVKSYRDEDTGGHTMVTFGQFENGKYFAVSDLTVSVFDADYWEAFISDEDGDMSDWYKEHLIANFNDFDPEYNEICSQLKGTVNYVAPGNKEKFIEYCKDKIVDLDEDIEIEDVMYTVAMHSEGIRQFRDVRVLINYDDEDDKLVVIDSDNDVVIDTYMIDCNQYAASMQFDKIDRKYYKMLMDFWDDINMDAYFE